MRITFSQAKLLLLLAFQIISGHVWARFFSYPGIPTPALGVVGFTPILLGLTCMLRVCLYRKGAMEGEKRGVGNVSFRCWKKLERTIGQLQVTDNLLTYGDPPWWKSHWSIMAPSGDSIQHSKRVHRTVHTSARNTLNHSFLFKHDQ